jgi:hypothetical protein
MQERFVETLFNLLWVAISLLLLGIWLVRAARESDDPVRHSIGLQLIALALLIVILLPVVSLTDDLHASALLAETDHVWRRGELQSITDLVLHTLSLTIPALTLLHAPPQSHTLASLSSPELQAAPFEGYLSILGTRPPPAI